MAWDKPGDWEIPRWVSVGVSSCRPGGEGPAARKLTSGLVSSSPAPPFTGRTLSGTPGWWPGPWTALSPCRPGRAPNRSTIPRRLLSHPPALSPGSRAQDGILWASRSKWMMRVGFGPSVPCRTLCVRSEHGTRTSPVFSASFNPWAGRACKGQSKSSPTSSTSKPAARTGPNWLSSASFLLLPARSLTPRQFEFGPAAGKCGRS